MGQFLLLTFAAFTGSIQPYEDHSNHKTNMNIKVIGFSPNSAVVEDKTEIKIDVEGFEGDKVFCFFNTSLTRGARVSSTRVVCPVPAVKKGTYLLIISENRYPNAVVGNINLTSSYFPFLEIFLTVLFTMAFISYIYIFTTIRNKSKPAKKIE